MTRRVQSICLDFQVYAWITDDMLRDSEVFTKGRAQGRAPARQHEKQIPGMPLRFKGLQK
jgi:hypothetical protein